MRALFRLFFGPDTDWASHLLGVLAILVLLVGAANIVAILLEAYHA